MKDRDLAVALVGMLIFVTGVCISEAKKVEASVPEPKEITQKITPTPTPSPTPTPTPTPTPNPAIAEVDSIRDTINSLETSCVYMEFEYIGDYFITAYCPEECGYRVYSDGSDNYPNGWVTATGTICHREEEWWNPSTCGINLSVNSYGDLFLIDGKVFVAEDTGPGVVGHWIDTFMPDYESMVSFGSHWAEVYSVEYIQTEPRVWHFDINDYIER